MALVKIFACVLLIGASHARQSTRQESSLTWGPCEVEIVPGEPNPATIDCAALEVPLDYTNISSSETMQLQLFRIKASQGTSKGSVLFNPGGPGQTGAETLSGLNPFLSTSTNGSFDIVTFDPRGTGKTLPFACPSYNASLPSQKTSIDLVNARGEFPESDIIEFLRTSGWSRAKTFADACYSDNRETGSYLSTAFVARDMLEIIDALNEDGMLRYYGLSYGTLLGQTFASMFPEKVDRMVLDGVVDLEDYMTGSWATAMLDSDKTFVNFLNECLAAPSLCPLAEALGPSTSVKDLLAAFGEILEELYESQRTIPIGIGSLSFEFGHGPTSLYEHIKRDMFMSTYSTGSFPSLSARLSEALERNFTSFEDNRYRLAVDEALENQSEIVTPYHEGQQSFWAIACSDAYVRSSSPEGIIGYVEAQAASSSLADSYVPQMWPCASWGFEPAERFDGKISGTTHKPILFVNGYYDPVTPMISAERASAKFEGSVLLRHTGHGHGSLSQLSSCTVTALQAYFMGGTLPEVGTECVPEMGAFEFAAASRATPANTTVGASSNENATTNGIDGTGVSSPSESSASTKMVASALGLWVAAVLGVIHF